MSHRQCQCLTGRIRLPISLHSNSVPISYRFRDIARLVEISKFFLPTCLMTQMLVTPYVSRAENMKSHVYSVHSCPNDILILPVSKLSAQKLRWKLKWRRKVKTLSEWSDIARTWSWHGYILCFISLFNVFIWSRQYADNNIFDHSFPCLTRSNQNSAVLAIIKTPAGISFNSWIRCYRVV